MTQTLFFRCLFGLVLLFPLLTIFPENNVVSAPSLNRFFAFPPMIAQAPTEPTFEEAIAQTKSLLTAIADAQISNEEFAQGVKQLVQSQNGVRGFFVTYLTVEPAKENGKVSIADHPSPELLQALSSSPEIVGELLVKNLAMSSATAVLHERNQDQDLAKGSELVLQRTINLIESLKLPIVATKLQALKTTIISGQGEYQDFLGRWHYDSEQKQAILKSVSSIDDSRDNSKN